MRKFVLFSLFLALLVPAVAGAQEADKLREIAAGTTASANAVLKDAAAKQKVEVTGDAVFVTSDDSSAAIAPVKGIENLTRQDLATWKTIGVFTAAGPPDATSPSGSFSVRVQANPGSTRGQFQIVDEAGTVVQEGELTIEDAPTAVAVPACYYPYGFRIFPYYYWGCHWWWYRWPWGYLNFHYCWWPFYRCCWWWWHWW